MRDRLQKKLHFFRQFVGPIVPNGCVDESMPAKWCASGTDTPTWLRILRVWDRNAHEKTLSQVIGRGSVFPGGFLQLVGKAPGKQVRIGRELLTRIVRLILHPRHDDIGAVLDKPGEIPQEFDGG